MVKKIRKGIIVPAVCLSLLASTPGNIFAANFEDAENHWAHEAINIWSGHEVIQGFEGAFRPDDSISRAEMAVMINRIMNYQDQAENTFEDLSDTWYTDAILKLVKHGIMQGHDNQIRPEDPVTREEALVMIARTLGVKSKQKSVSFQDSDKISDWALEAVAAMTEKGFIHGYEDGSFRPGEKMTRACSVTVINNSIKGFYNKPGTYQAEEELNGYVIVSSPDVVLEGMTINGDLILSPGVKDGTVTLKGSSVSGEQIIMGGNVESEPGSPTTPPSAEPSASPSAAPSSTPDSGGSGGSSGGGSGVQTAADTDVLVNSSYADKTGSITYNSKRYTIGKNAFDNLEAAIAQAETLNKKANITLLSDFSLSKTIIVQSSDLTFDGNQHTLTFDTGVKDGLQIVTGQNILVKDLSIQMQDETNKWNGSYGIQAYQSAVTLKDVRVSGADAAVLVNGANVTLEGIVDVSGNEFGGIEVSKGVGVETLPKLSGSAENLKNDSEIETGKPTIWIDKISELNEDVVAVTGLNKFAADNDQVHYFLGKIPAEITAEVKNSGELEAALQNPQIEIINIAEDIVADKTLSVSKSVIIRSLADAKTISFENKKGFQIENAPNVTFENIKLEITGDEEGWQSLYVLQAYGASNVVLKNITATGGDAGILVNGAVVTLEGVVDVSGNEFGGIEVAKGVGVESSPRLIGETANLKNDSEASSKKPTVWIDKVSELTKAVVEITGMNEVEKENDQLYFYLGEAPADPDAVK